ncbi:unnamed protein product [Closterium sp. NIES-65]|nr:unnamed protein product [Closterium sp. NIES-65]
MQETFKRLPPHHARIIIFLTYVPASRWFFVYLTRLVLIVFLSAVIVHVSEEMRHPFWFVPHCSCNSCHVLLTFYLPALLSSASPSIFDVSEEMRDLFCIFDVSEEMRDLFWFVRDMDEPAPTNPVLQRHANTAFKLVIGDERGEEKGTSPGSLGHGRAGAHQPRAAETCQHRCQAGEWVEKRRSEAERKRGEDRNEGVSDGVSQNSWQGFGFGVDRGGGGSMEQGVWEGGGDGCGRAGGKMKGNVGIAGNNWGKLVVREAGGGQEVGGWGSGGRASMEQGEWSGGGCGCGWGSGEMREGGIIGGSWWKGEGGRRKRGDWCIWKVEEMGCGGASGEMTFEVPQKEWGRLVDMERWRRWGMGGQWGDGKV